MHSVSHFPGLSPPGRIKVALHEVIERPHVFFFRKQHMVSDALQNLKRNIIVIVKLKSVNLCKKPHVKRWIFLCKTFTTCKLEAPVEDKAFKIKKKKKVSA